MKKNYNIKLNQEQPSSEDISRHMDFDALLANYQEQQQKPGPLRIRWVMYAASAAVAAAIAGWFILVGLPGSSNYERQQAQYFESQPYINPPVTDVKAEFASYSIAANQGGTYEYPSGSKLIIPAEAFEDENGNIVNGEVNIHYREMHDYVDFFLSGIPMVYDSASVRYTLESAGMIEIYAEQDGKRVRMRDDKSIDVELVSSVNSPNINVAPSYNIYKLDDANRKWVYQDIDRIQVLESNIHDIDPQDPFYDVSMQFQDQLFNLRGEEESALTDLESQFPIPSRPVRPIQHNGTDFVFDLDVQTENGVQPYAGALWQISPDEDVSPSDLNRNWDDMELVQLNNRDYSLTLITFDDNPPLTLVVNPVLSGEDFERAISSYNEEMAQYEQMMRERELAISDQRDSVIKLYAQAKSQLESAFQEQVQTFRSQGNAFANRENITRQKVVNRFRATSLGIWNCDRPLPPQMVQMRGKFVGKDGTEFTDNVAYLVDHKRNTVSRFYVNDKTDMRFDFNSNNLMWLVTDDNRLAVFRPEDFQRIKADARKHTFVMEVVDREIESEEDVREILYF